MRKSTDLSLVKASRGAEAQACDRLWFRFLLVKMIYLIFHFLALTTALSSSTQHALPLNIPFNGNGFFTLFVCVLCYVRDTAWNWKKNTKQFQWHKWSTLNIYWCFQTAWLIKHAARRGGGLGVPTVRSRCSIPLLDWFLVTFLYHVWLEF